MLKKEHEILAPFVREPWRGLTFRQVKECARKTSAGYTYAALKRFVKGGILDEEAAGNVILYRLRRGSLRAHAYAGCVAEHLAFRKRGIPYGELEKLPGLMPTSFFILLITGSYAKGMQRRDSDLDVVVICDDSADPRGMRAELSHQCEMSLPEIHLQVFREREFVSMLLAREENFGKEAARNNLVAAGGESYYRILSEAIAHGFAG